MIFGPDLSKFQTANAMDGYDFVILNVEDPTLDIKVNHAYDIGIRWDIYKWCYPGQVGQQMLNTAQARVGGKWRPGTRRPQFWLDYEEAGVEPWQIDQWYAACDEAGETSGLYCYSYLMNSQGLTFTRDGWEAYYPGSNDGSYWPSMSDEARARGAKLHQYTSTNGTLDKNVVLDEAWYGATPLPPLPPLPPEDDEVLYYIEKASDSTLGLYVTNDLWKRHVEVSQFDWIKFADPNSQAFHPLKVSDEWWDAIPTVS